MQLRAPVARPVDVLIASTHEWTSRSLASILAPHGYVFYRAYNRAQTLRRIRSNPPDAIIVDEQLPDGDGYTLCRELNEENLVSPSTPVFLALPRSPTRRDRLAALQASAWVCLGDPLDAEELTAMLEVFVPAKLEADQARMRGLVDDVTGVYNLRGLTRRAEELAAQASRRHAALCCVLLKPEIERDADGGGRRRPIRSPGYCVALPPRCAPRSGIRTRSAGLTRARLRSSPSTPMPPRLNHWRSGLPRPSSPRLPR